IVARRQSAGAGNALRLEGYERSGESVDAGKMRSIGVRARNELDASIEDQRGVLGLHNRRERLDAVGERAFAGEGGRISDLRCDEIKARGGAWVRRFRSWIHGSRMVAQSGGKLTGNRSA